MKTKSILELTPAEAKSFFLRKDSFFSNKLPEYFKFEKLLKNLSAAIPETCGLAELCKIYNGQVDFPFNYRDINYRIYNSKDGGYAWRALTLPHPVLYIILVNTVTRADNWEKIIRVLKTRAALPHVSCESLPIVSKTKRAQDEIMITNWHHKVEQETLEKSLDYNYIAEADIANCYSDFEFELLSAALDESTDLSASAKTQDAYANSRKTYAKTTGAELELTLRQIVSGKTSGLPQSGELMHFLAEIIFSLIDERLETVLKETLKEDYYVIRYRDDFRIFTHSQEAAEIILRSLNNILRDINLKLNPSKIKVSSDIISRALKEDKFKLITRQVELLYPLEHHEVYHHNLEKTLLALRAHNKDFPQSGSVERIMAEIYEKQIYPLTDQIDGIEQLVAIILDIMKDSPRCYGIGIAMIGKLTEKWSASARLILVSKIRQKFARITNTEILELWLQRLTLPINRNVTYSSHLCQKVYLGEQVKLWNSAWLKDGIMPEESIVNEDMIRNLTPAIPLKYVRLFSFDRQ